MSSIVSTALERILLARSLSRRISPCRSSGPGLSRTLLWCDFSLNQCCRSTDLWLLHPYGAHNLHPELRYSSNSSNDQVPGNQPIRRQHVMCNHVHSIVFACIFSHRKALFRFNGTPWIFLTTLCSVSSGFLPNLFLISFCIQNRLRENHCLRSPSFCSVFTVYPLRKWPRWYEEAKREKTVEEWTGSKLRSWSWSFVPAATCACLQPLTKHWSIYAKAATIVSPV